MQRLRKKIGKLCQSYYERAFTIFHSDGILTQEAGGEEGLASPRASVEAQLSLWVRGRELPCAACLEKGKQTPLVPADNTADCVGRHCSSTGWRKHMPQCLSYSSPLRTMQLGRQEGVSRLLIEIVVEFHVSETSPEVVALGLHWVLANPRLMFLRGGALLQVSVPNCLQSCESKEELETFFFSEKGSEKQFLH